MRPIFPATYSSLSPEALAALISERYSLKDASCKLLMRGVGDTYAVNNDQGRRVLRVYRSSYRSRRQIESEVSLLCALKQAGVSVAGAIADKNGAYLQVLNAVEGERFAVLFEYAAGKPLSALSDSQLQEFGRQVGRFHNVSAALPFTGDRWTFDVNTTLFEPLKLLSAPFADLPAEYAWWQETANRAARHLQEADSTNFSKGYCHFDLLPKNFHFEGDKVTLFDFDFMGYGWLVNDLMTFWMHLMLDAHFGKMTRQRADESFATFIEAYREFRPVSDAELSLLSYLGVGFWLFYMGFHTTHDQFSYWLQPELLKSRTAMVKAVLAKNVPLCSKAI